MTLTEFFHQNQKAAIAFSGGVDSAYLLYAAMRYAKRVHAYTVHSQFQPRFELDDARRLATELGAALSVLPLDVLAVPGAVTIILLLLTRRKYSVTASFSPAPPERAWTPLRPGCS